MMESFPALIVDDDYDDYDDDDDDDDDDGDEDATTDTNALQNTTMRPKHQPRPVVSQ